VNFRIIAHSSGAGEVHYEYEIRLSRILESVLMNIARYSYIQTVVAQIVLIKLNK
jgi:hypothetical protein